MEFSNFAGTVDVLPMTSPLTKYPEVPHRQSRIKSRANTPSLVCCPRLAINLEVLRGENEARKFLINEMFISAHCALTEIMTTEPCLLFEFFATFSCHLALYQYP